MSETVLIDGKKLDVNSRISTNIRNLDLSKLTDMVVPYTNTIKAPNNPNNRKLLGHSNVTTIQSPGSYEEKKASVIASGMPVILNGKTTLLDIGDEMNLNIVGQDIDFYKNIADKTLKDLTFNPTNFDYDETPTPAPDWIKFLIIETWMNTCDYSTHASIGSFNAYHQQINHADLIPWIKTSKLMELIAEQSGLNVDFSILNEVDDYANSWTTMLVPDDLTWDQLRNVVIADWMHEEDQAAYFKSVLSQCGAFIVSKGGSLQISTLSRIQHLKSSGINWSDKLSTLSTPIKSFEVGYSVINEFKYKDIQEYQIAGIEMMDKWNNIAVVDVTVPNSGNIISDNKNLSNKKRVHEVIFEQTLEITVESDQGHARKIPYIPCWDAVNSVFKASYGIQNIVVPTSATVYERTGGATESWTVTGGPPPNVAADGLIIPWFSSQEDESNLTNSGDSFGLSFNEKLIPNNYGPAASKFIREPLSVSAEMNLSILDVAKYIDSSGYLPTNSKAELSIAPVFIRELGGYFHVQEIRNFIEGLPSRVKLIRV